jgi:mannose-6-phosphate isomerase-like protein (cupin superfamily)
MAKKLGKHGPDPAKKPSERRTSKKRRVGPVVGAHVEVLWEGGLYAAEVVKCHRTGEYDVVYEKDGTEGTFVTHEEHRLLPLEQGVMTLAKSVISGDITATKLCQYAKKNGLHRWKQDEGCDWKRPCLFTSRGYVTHTHPMNEAIFVQSGTITVTDVKRGIEIVASAGDIIKIPEGVKHKERCSENGTEALGVLFEYD